MIKKKILLVEDNPGDAEIIREILEYRKGGSFELTIKPTLRDALDFLDHETVEIILLDLGLPDSKGVDSIAKIKSGHPFIPVVVITGNDDERVGLEAVKNGAQDYILKGMIPDHYLTKVIHYAIHRQESEVKLRQSEEKYKSIVENIGIGVVLIDTQRRVLESNSLMNKWYPDLLNDGEIKCYKSMKCLCQGTPDHDTCPVALTLKHATINRAIERQGQAVFRLLSSPIKDSQGQVKGAILLKEDITERMLIENKIRQAQKMESLGTLAGGIAHDFNNILTAIHGYASLAKYDAPEGSKIIEDLSEILRASNRASDLVKQILTFSRMADFEKKPIRIDIIVKEVLKLLKSTIPSNIEILNQVEKSSKKITADPTQIHQIMMNLCTNAAYAMEETGGVLDVSLSEVMLTTEFIKPPLKLKKGPYLKLVVKDTGTGIDPEIIESIFDPYFTTKGVGDGTGLGLSVTQGIVDDCGGQILVDSKLDEGSCFTLFFPVSEKKQADPAPLPSELELYGNETILLVDDEAPILKLGSRILEKYGYNVCTESNGKDALRFIKANHQNIDLVVSDMTMPKMTGLELAANIRELSIDLPFIIMTGYSRLISDEKIEKHHINAVINKPLSNENLSGLVRKTLDERGA